MNTFVPFTEARKNMIATARALLTDPKNLKLDRNHYGNRIHHLFFRDYLVYAVLCGADFRKASHPEGLDYAICELKNMASVLDGFLGNYKSYHAAIVHRYLPEEGGDAAELKALIDAALTNPGV